MYEAPYSDAVRVPTQLAERAEVLWRATRLLPRTWLLVAWLWARARGPHVGAMLRLRRAVRRPSAGPEPLRAHAVPGLFEVEPSFLAQARGSAELPPVLAETVVLHLLGTGENVYSPLPGLLELCRREPRLAGVRHVIVDTPHDPGCFLGPNEFATRMRRIVEPLLQRHCEGIVLVGLSRGANLALGLGAEYACATGARVGIVALAPPLARPGRPPRSVIHIGGFEPIAENFVRQLELFPWARPLGTWILRELYLAFSAFVLAELRMISECSIDLYARHVRAHSPAELCLRSVREFALLSRVSDVELRHALSHSLQQLAHGPHARAHVCFGDRDGWVDVAPCLARLAELRARHAVSDEQLQVVRLSDVGHGIAREPAQDFGPVAALLLRACEHARGAAFQES